MAVDRIVFVTGLSGAGKSQTMKTFEDLGYYCVDNLPPNLVPDLLASLDRAQLRRAAVALDVRSGGAMGNARLAIEESARNGVRPQTLFLDARDDVLLRRYSETRRRHPFAAAGSLREAIAIERSTLAPLRALSSAVIDTTSLSHAELKERILERFDGDGATRLAITIVAFGFKYGIPLDLDMLFDVRFLRNPNYEEALRPLTGNDRAVAAFIEADPYLEPFMTRLIDTMEFLLPRFLTEGKSHATVGIGCTGGRHRSVYVARRLFAHLESRKDTELYLDSRDVLR